MKKQIIFNIAGGVGKNIIATNVVSALKKMHPDRDIIITTPWGLVWDKNPNIKEIVDLEKTPDFYNTHVRGTDSLIFRLEPYSSDDFFHKRKHLTEIWKELCGLKINKSDENINEYIPELYFSDLETKKVKKMLFPNDSDKRPLFFIQSSGGAQNQWYPISWARDLPLVIAQEIVDEMNKKGYRTIHLRRETQIPLKDVEWIPFTLREALCAIQFSNKRLFVDSVAAHAAAALDKPSVVTWVTNDPKLFGYPMHHNIETKEPKVFRHLPDAYLEPYNINGVWNEHPFETDKIFDPKEILEKLLKD